MAAPSDDSDEDDYNFIILGTPVPDVEEGQALKKPIAVHDLPAKDKHGKLRFHGAFTGGFSAGYFNTVGTKEGFNPTTFISSRTQKQTLSERAPEDFMDDEDFDEHGIAPRKFATTTSYTSEDRKRKLGDDVRRQTSEQSDRILPIGDLIIPEQSVGIKILIKMGWREGQGLGPRIKKKTKKKKKGKPSPNKVSSGRVYGCALPPSDQEDADSDHFVPEDLSNVTFAPKDVCPISLEPKDNVHGLGYRGLNPSLALPGSYSNLFKTQPVRSRAGGKGIQGQAFGVGALEEEDDDIYGVDSMSNYNTTLLPEDLEEGDSKFGWTAPRAHGKQSVPVSYVGKLLEGFTLSSQTLKPKKKYPAPVLPPHFRPQHWVRKRREVGHLSSDLTRENQVVKPPGKVTAVDRGLMLGETPVFGSVFDLVSKEDQNRLHQTKESVLKPQSLNNTTSFSVSDFSQQSQRASGETVDNSVSLPTSSQHTSGGSTQAYFSKFKPAGTVQEETPPAPSDRQPLFQGSLTFQPFRKDAAKQARYDAFLASLKQGSNNPYSSVDSSRLTDWEKSKEKEEFSQAAKIYRPMSAMMSSRFVRGSMIDDDRGDSPATTELDKNDQLKAAEMKMFGKLTREEYEWHPDKILCRRFNVPNPYPESDIVGLPTVKRDKFSVFTFLNFADYQAGEFQEPSAELPEASVASTEVNPVLPTPQSKTTPSRSKRATMASIFKVLDDPDFHKPPHKTSVENTTSNSLETEIKPEIKETEENDGQASSEDDTGPQPDKDLFRAIFKNSDSESDESSQEEKGESVKEEHSENSDDQAETQDGSFKGQDMETGSKEIEPGTCVVIIPLVQDDEIKKEVPTASHQSPVASWDSGFKSHSSRFGRKSIFHVLDSLDFDDKPRTDDRGTPGEVAGDGRVTGLSPPHLSDESNGPQWEYGPRLPPTSAAKSAESSSSVPGLIAERIMSSHSKSKQHKHRKEKKKKSKHKKEKKHKQHRKSSKSKRSKRHTSSSGSEADTETSDVSDSELLEKLKQVSRSATQFKL